jgi:hypothetical protein
MKKDMENIDHIAKNLILEGKKVEALKTVKKLTGWDLQKTNDYLKMIINETPPIIPESYIEAAQIIETRLPSMKNNHYKFSVQELLDSAEKDLNDSDIFNFPDWNNVVELNVYESDQEILEIVFKDIKTEGDVIVIGFELDDPLETTFNRLYEDIELLPAYLSPFDMVFIWKDKPIVTVVGHWGVYAHLK